MDLDFLSCSRCVPPSSTHKENECCVFEYTGSIRNKKNFEILGLFGGEEDVNNATLGSECLFRKSSYFNIAISGSDFLFILLKVKEDMLYCNRKTDFPVLEKRNRVLKWPWRARKIIVVDLNSFWWFYFIKIMTFLFKKTKISYWKKQN